MKNDDSCCGIMIFLVIVFMLFLFLGKGFLENMGRYMNSPHTKAGSDEASLYFIGLVALGFVVYKVFKH